MQLCGTACEMPEGWVESFLLGAHSSKPNQSPALPSLNSEQFPKLLQYIHLQKVKTLGANPRSKAA